MCGIAFRLPDVSRLYIWRDPNLDRQQPTQTPSAYGPTQAIGQSRLFSPFDVLAQPMDRLQDLIVQVIVVVCPSAPRSPDYQRGHTNFELAALSPQIIRMERPVRLCRPSARAVLAKTDDVGNDIMCPHCDTFRLHAQSDLDMRLRLFVGIVFGVLAEALYVS